MNRRERLERLSLTPTYIPCWLALALVVAIYVVTDPVADFVLSGSSVALAVLGCFLGWKPDQRLAERTNRGRRIAILLFTILVVGAIVFHFAVWEPYRQVVVGKQSVDRSLQK